MTSCNEHKRKRIMKLKDWQKTWGHEERKHTNLRDKRWHLKQKKKKKKKKITT